MGFFSRLKAGLSKTRDGFVKNMDYVFSGFSRIDEDFYEELEEVLISGDLGVQTSMRLIENLRQEVKDQHIKEAGDCRQLLIDDIRPHDGWRQRGGENHHSRQARRQIQAGEEKKSPDRGGGYLPRGSQ